MSKWVSEIIKDIKDNPNTWKPNKHHGISKDNIVLTNFYNGALLSVCDIHVNGRDMYTSASYLDWYRLERAYQHWCKVVDLEVLTRATTI